ncbi:MAG: cation:proton antiporter, partial [Gemmatimonadota bacterium]|nr:cation:proton antiporter [Gemmatimonadota bacterium]
MRRFVVLLLLLGLMALLQVLQAGSDTALNSFSLATFGFVLLAAYTLGQVAANLQLPKITGYIVTGLMFGPQVLNVFSSAVEADLRVVNDLAIGLIALSAGGEMHLAGLRKIARSLLLITLIKGGLILVAVTGAVLALAPLIPFLDGQSLGLVLSVGMILGVLAIGTSPAATIAVINETGAKGRLADTTLGVAVVKDIVMVVLLALSLALAQTFSADGHGFEAAILGELALELSLSLLAGAALGGIIIAYLKYVGAEPWLFVVGVIFAMTAVAHEFHLEALLVFIVAGFVVQNASTLGHGFVELVERVALPVYVVFFSVAGAGLDLAALRTVLLIAVAIALVRLGAIYTGTALATKLAGEPE